MNREMIFWIVCTKARILIFMHPSDFFYNNGFFTGMGGGMYAFFGLFALLALVDLALKGWGMWRAAKMNKQGWFIALLLINSLGILPAIFLLITKDDYEKMTGKSAKKRGSDKV